MTAPTVSTPVQPQDEIDYTLVHEIHTSGRKSYRNCRRRWNWLFNDAYYPIVTGKPLEFGTCYHVAMEVFYNPDTWNAPRAVIAQLAIKAFVDKCEAQRRKFLDQSKVPYLEAEVQKDYDERVELGKGMLAYYFSRVSPKEDVGFRPVKVEMAFKVPIKHPDTGEILRCTCDDCWTKFVKAHTTTEYDFFQSALVNSFEGLPRDKWLGLPVVYAGRIDMLCVDENGDYWIFDWKTAARLWDDTDAYLDLDDQIGSYVWAFNECGIRVRGFVYVEQWKDFPKPPKENKVVRKGCRFSVSKSEPTEYTLYRETVMAEDRAAFEAGYYDEFLSWLAEEGPTYYRRFQKHKNEFELGQIGYNIGQETLEMIDPNLRIYPAPTPSWFGCKTCAFRIPCTGKNQGEDYQYALDTLYERREHYWVREEPSTESKGGE
jgi:hypothetical protein